MGVEKHLDSSSSASARLNKSHSVDIYRPPALRRNVEPLENYNYQLPQQGDQQQGPQEQKDALQSHADDVNSISNNFSSPASSNSSDTNQNCCNDSDSAATVTPTTASSNQRQVRRERRPDRAVYVPRARRSQTTPPSVSTQQQPHNQPLQQAALAVTESNNQLTSLTATSSLSCGINTAPNTATTGTCKSPVEEKSLGNHNRRLNKERVNTSSGRKEKISSKRLSIDENEKIINHKSNNSIGALSSHENIRDSRIQYMKNAPVPIAGNEHLNGLSDCTDKNALLVKDCVFSHSKELSDSTNTNSTNVKKRVKIATSEVKKVTPKMSATSPPATAAPTPSLSSQMIPESMGNLRIEDALINGEERSEKCDRDAEELLRASKEINRSNRRIMKQTFNSDILEIPEKALFNSNTIIKSKSKDESKHVSTSGTDDEQEDDWDSMYNESGDCLDPKILQELTASVGKVRIELPKMDYSAYLSKQSILNEEEFPHVLEVSNFPVEFKNQDLMMVFSQYKESGFDIKWVDDTHALAVFSSSQIAAEVLSMGHPFVVLKPLAEATAESRQKAKNCSTSLRPYRPRPETCPALARRLVTGALGVRLKTAAQERENEIRVLREAKERKLLAAKQRDESWES